MSSKTQSTKAQQAELAKWSDSRPLNVKWFTDVATGSDMNRPGWNNLMIGIRQGSIKQVVIWRLDRLGRTASGLTKLFDELNSRGINLISLKDGLDLSTAAGRLMANVLASVAQFEREIRQERQSIGIAKAKSEGKKWGGSKAGVRKKVTDTQIRLIKGMFKDGESKSMIAKTLHLSRPTIYQVLREE